MPDLDLSTLLAIARCLWIMALTLLTLLIKACNTAVSACALLNLQRLNPQKPLYHLYADRVAGVRRGSPDPQWDDVTSF